MIQGLRHRSALKRYMYMEMAETLADAGFNVGYKKIRSKMDNLLKTYRLEVKAMIETGGLPSTWPHFERMHKLVGPKESKGWLKKIRAKNSQPYKIKSDDEEFASITSPVESFIIESSEDSGSRRFKKRALKRNRDYSAEKTFKKTVNNPEMTPFELAMIEVVKERTEDLRRAATERLDVLRTFLDSKIEFQNKSLEMISKNQ